MVKWIIFVIFKPETKQIQNHCLNVPLNLIGYEFSKILTQKMESSGLEDVPNGLTVPYLVPII